MAGRRRRVLGMWLSRPRLTAAVVTGLVVGLGCWFAIPAVGSSTSTIVGWDAFCLTFAGVAAIATHGRGPNSSWDKPLKRNLAGVV